MKNLNRTQKTKRGDRSIKMIQSEEKEQDGKKRTETEWRTGYQRFNVHDA